MSRQRSSAAFYVVTGVILLIGTVFLLYVLPILASPQTSLFIGDGIFRTQVVATQGEREKGLSGVSKLDPDQALLMVFPGEDKWGIGMKDMKIPIDIVWLDNDKKIVYIVTNASSGSSADEIFVPKSDAKYVIELPAGTVSSKAITINKKAIFQLSDQGV